MKHALLGILALLVLANCHNPKTDTADKNPRLELVPEPDKAERLAYEAHYPSISDTQKKAYLALTALCVHNKPEREKIEQFIETLRQHDDDEDYLTIFNYFLDFLNTEKLGFIMRMDWKADIRELEWMLETWLKSQYNLSLPLPEPSHYSIGASVPAEGVFENFDDILRKNGLQLGFIDAQSDEYIAVLHKIDDKQQVSQAVNDMGYGYYDIKE